MELLADMGELIALSLSQREIARCFGIPHLRAAVIAREVSATAAAA